MAVLRATFYQLFLIVTVIPYAIACMLWSPLPLRWRYRLTVGWPRLAVWGAKVILGIRWQLKGAENFPDGPAILLSKHQSAWETLFFPAYMPRELCFVYKKELHLIPFFGWGLALLRMIPIDRSKGRDAFEQVVRVGQDRINAGRWPILFPEGTRSRTMRLSRPHPGAGLIAFSKTGPPAGTTTRPAPGPDGAPDAPTAARHRSRRGRIEHPGEAAGDRELVRVLLGDGQHHRRGVRQQHEGWARP